MKAFLLSAGYGTRLKPLTNNIPKCLVPICGKPLLAWWMDLFEKHGINEVLINTHYLADEVREFIEYYNAQKTGVTLIESYEKDLLGSGGTVAINKSFIKNEEKFLICYADNLTNIDLSELIKFHTKKQGILTMGLFYTNNPKECGIAAIDSHDLIVGYYGAANKIIDSIKGILNPISLAIFPYISQQVIINKSNAILFIRKVLKCYSIFGFIMFFILFIFSDEIVSVLLGVQYEQSIILIKILSAIPFLVAISNVLGTHTLLTFGYNRIYSRILLVSALISIILIIPMSYFFSDKGAAFTMLLTEFCVTLMMYVSLRKLDIHIMR